MKKDITKIPVKFRGSFWKYLENFYVNKLDNLEETDKFLDT
jgi:hypothetical protein